VGELADGVAHGLIGHAFGAIAAMEVGHANAPDAGGERGRQGLDAIAQDHHDIGPEAGEGRAQPGDTAAQRGDVGRAAGDAAALHGDLGGHGEAGGREVAPRARDQVHAGDHRLQPQPPLGRDSAHHGASSPNSARVPVTTAMVRFLAIRFCFHTKNTKAR